MTGQDAVNTAKCLQRGGRRHRHRDDPDGRRRSRRCGACRCASVTGAPIKLTGVGREARCAGGVPSRNGSPAASSASATWSGWSRSACGDDRSRRRPKSSPARWQRGTVRSGRLRQAQLKQINKMGSLSSIIGDAAGRAASCRRSWRGPARPGSRSQKHAGAAGGDHRLDDAEGAAHAGHPERPVAQEADRRRVRHQRAGSEQAG